MTETQFLEHIKALVDYIDTWEIEREYQRTLQNQAYKSISLLSRRVLEYSITRIDKRLEQLKKEGE